MGKKKRKPQKKIIAVVVSALTAAVIIAAILITNIFIPVKYFTAYTVKKRPNEVGALRITYISAGFGDSALIELPDGKNVLVDGGSGAYPVTSDILRTLNSHGVKRIDCLICTSVKEEHCGGLAEIVKYKQVGYAFIPYSKNTRLTGGYHKLLNALKDRNIEYDYACAGAGMYNAEEDYFLTFLSPTNYRSPASEYAAMNSQPTASTIDNASAMVWLSFNGVSFMFASDVREGALKRVADDYNLSKQLNLPYCPLGGFSVNPEECKVMTAPNHAGKDGVYTPIYDLLKPERVIISVGDNFAGYPSDAALADICNYCQPLYTSYDGNIIFKVRDGSYTVSTKGA